MMRTIAATLATAFLVLVLGGAGVVYAGWVNVAATVPHARWTLWLVETARVRSIKAHAAGIAVPPGLDERATILTGAEHYAAHCAVCHGAPGVPKGDIAQGLYPRPPSLVGAAKAFSPSELFWIVKNGLKMTGMPAWSDHSDDELWATVAFLEKLPGMTEPDYAALIMATMRMGGQHQHDRGETPSTGHADAPESHRH